MATTQQRTAARRNIKKAQSTWRRMSHRAHARAQPQGRGRKRPGLGGRGSYYRVQVRPKKDFVTFRTHDVGRRGHTQRIAGKRRSGSWATQTWLIHKDDAHRRGEQLVIDAPKVKTLDKSLRGSIVHTKGNVFVAKPRKNVPERAKPTRAQRQAQRRNIKKAQAARR